MTSGSRRDYDVIVVGASIAGCTAAIMFGRAGLHVGLVERRADPNAYKKVCTHYIQPSALPTIRRLGLEEQFVRAGAVRTELEAWTRWGWVRSAYDHPQLRPYGYNLRRRTLDPLL